MYSCVEVVLPSLKELSTDWSSIRFSRRSTAQTCQPGAAETVELVFADSGCGVSPDDKEKLFLPYFSTKNRGTGLGLAIVNHIIAEHNAQIRVEDNQPVGARFTVEIPAILEPDAVESAVPLAVRPAAARV